MPNQKRNDVAEMTLPQLKAKLPKVVVLPFGATEPHGHHLPYGTDVYQVEAIAERACQLACEQGAAVATLPCIPFGVQTSQQTYPLAMNLYPSTLNRIINDLTESLDNSGIEKAVLLNGHGGNDFYTHLKEMYGRRQVFVVQVNWFAMCRDLQAKLFPAGGDHAHDVETALMLHLRPDLVDMAQAGPQATAKYRLAGMRAGWAKAPRPWEKFTQDSGAGDPRGATGEKGARLFEAITGELGAFLVELAGAKIDATFPFE